MQKISVKLSVTLVRRFLADETGATAIEYSLITAGIAGAIIGVVGTLGVNVKTMWTTIANALG
ncbi:MAG: Flp family type IVb pilin [Pseudolabrys sp.]